MRGRKPATIITFAGSNAPAPKRPPAWLAPYARAEWSRVVPPLIERRVLTATDYGSLEAYCVAIGQVREFSEKIAALEDEMVYSESGVPRPHPYFRMVKDASATARQFAAELGLTPVSRSRANVTMSSDNDEWSGMDL